MKKKIKKLFFLVLPVNCTFLYIAIGTTNEELTSIVIKIILMAISRQFSLYWLTQRATNRIQTFEKWKTGKSPKTQICPPVVIFKGLWSDSLMLPSGES